MAKRSVAALLLVVASLVAAAAVSFASPGAVTRAHRQAAGRVADQLLASVALPPGSVKLAGEPADDSHQLATPVFGVFFAAEIDRHAFWTTSASPAAVIASFAAHRPSGAKPLGSGSGGGGAFAAYRMGPGRAYTPALRQLVVDAVVLANGATGVRADAEVRYAAPRPEDQQVPRSARVLQVTVSSHAAAPSLDLTITRRSKVRAIAAMG